MHNICKYLEDFGEVAGWERGAGDDVDFKLSPINILRARANFTPHSFFHLYSK